MPWRDHPNLLRVYERIRKRVQRYAVGSAPYENYDAIYMDAVIDTLKEVYIETHRSDYEKEI